MDRERQKEKARERRNNKQKKRKKVKNVIINEWSDTFFEDDWVEDQCRKLTDNFASCSCYMCGNKRKHFKDETLQEKKFKDLEKAEIEEFKEENENFCF